MEKKDKNLEIEERFNQPKISSSFGIEKLLIIYHMVYLHRETLHSE